ncbi:MAG: hypothetical protein JWP89_413 [Schlesneria sp.]|nr:hypothetical protein [Schlesneria sp.]
MFRLSSTTAGLFAILALIVGCQTRTSSMPNASTAQTGHADGDEHQHSTGENHDDHSTQTADPKVTATLAKLNPEDRKIAEQQQYCAVMNNERLGSMGVPVKLAIKGEPVFVCCAGCKAKALKKPDETLAKVAALKSSHKSVQP